MLLKYFNYLIFLIKKKKKAFEKIKNKLTKQVNKLTDNLNKPKLNF